MLKAIVLAQIALYVAVLAPGVSDKIPGLRGLDIGLWGWAVSLIGPVLTVVFCELAKVITYLQVRQYQARLLKKKQLEEAKWQNGPGAETLPALIKSLSDPQIV